MNECYFCPDKPIAYVRFAGTWHYAFVCRQHLAEHVVDPKHVAEVMSLKQGIENVRTAQQSRISGASA